MFSNTSRQKDTVDHNHKALTSEHSSTVPISKKNAAVNIYSSKTQRCKNS